MKKLTSLFIGILILALLVTACTGNNTPNDTPNDTANVTENNDNTNDAASEAPELEYLNLEGPLPVANSPIEMSGINVKTSAASGGPNKEMWFTAWMREKANLDLDLKRIDLTAWEEQKNIMFAANQLPDFFINTPFSYNDIMRYGQEEKQFIPLNDLIDKYAPNIKKALDEDPELLAAITAPDGNIYSLFTTGSKELTPDNSFVLSRYFINEGWLKKVGLEEPQTLDDFYNMLKAFKEEDPDGNGEADSVPLSGSWGSAGLGAKQIILNALGFNSRTSTGMMVKDGKVSMPAADPLFKEYLGFMSKLYAEGLLDKDVFTQKSTEVSAKVSQNKVGVVGAVPAEYWFNEEPGWTPVSPLTSEWNDEKIWTDGHYTTAGVFMITKNAKHPEALIRFADLFFIDRYNFILWNGPEHDSEDALGYDGWYKDEEGKKGTNLPEGVKSVWQFVNIYNPIGAAGPINKIPTTQPLADIWGFPNPELPPNELAWRLPVLEKIGPYLKTPFPKVYLLPEDIEKSLELETPIMDYINQMEARFVAGDVKMDEFDTYIERLNDLGIQEYIQIYQKAYDAYENNRK